MKKYFPIWLILRVVVVLAVSAFILQFNVAHSNITWIAVPISIAIGALFSAYTLFLDLKRGKMDLTAPLSVTRPFWPRSRNPIRYWLLVSGSLMLAGVLAMGKNCYLHGGRHLAFGAIFVSMGFGFLLPLMVWLRTRKS